MTIETNTAGVSGADTHNDIGNVGHPVWRRIYYVLRAYKPSH